ncbi:MAG: glycosyltransferase family 39 protein [Candidatus Zixiibacteriota bacterium]|nr:MAG: glycosyltransferase family 39 protein [candidate division Zixibacteria bacterium]
MKNLIQKYPLASVLTVALALRLVAVIFSKGFMASDDHYVTVEIAYRWLNNGLFGENGFITWGTEEHHEISRFPLYNILLFLNMKVMSLLGCETLDEIMYGVRLAHAFFSLIAVAAVYKIVEIASGSKNWAVAAGMIVAAHFLMPFLSVRNMIEVVGGTLWVTALLCVYKHRREDRPVWLIWAGILSGLAWMIRFQMVLAFWILPLVLWYEHRRLIPALQYVFAVAVVILVSGVADWYLMGTFMGTTINYIGPISPGEAVYPTNVLIYPVLIIAVFIPPASLVATWLALKKNFWKYHLPLVLTTLSFILGHYLVANRQERFMIPIFPAVLVIFVLAIHQHCRERGFFTRWRKTRAVTIGLWLAINTVLLGLFTVNYSHKGLVEPLVRIQQLSDSKPMVLLVSPDKRRIWPGFYSGAVLMNRRYVMDWNRIDAAFRSLGDTVEIDYYLLYPPDSADLPRYVDSLVARSGPIRQVFHVGPSAVDYVLHMLNPEHNPTNEVWAYQNAAP